MGLPSYRWTGHPVHLAAGIHCPLFLFIAEASISTAPNPNLFYCPLVFSRRRATSQVA